MRLKQIPLIAALVAFLVAAGGSAQDVPSKKNGGVLPPGPPTPQQEKQRPTRQQLIDTFGTAQISYYRIPASEFTPLSSSSDEPYSDYWYDQCCDLFRRYSNGVTGYYVASPHLPSGATVTYFELDGCNTNATNTVDGYLYDCNYLGDCTATAPAHAQIESSAGCTYRFTNPSFNVDNYTKAQVVRVVTGAGNNTTNFSGVIIGYNLNVSPAPGTATFNDVPLSDPAFQYIEAFNRASITAGCSVSPPLYCPDNFVTRRQMAVFFAKALGLQFN